MQMTIEQIPSHRIAYFRQKGPYGANNKRTMEELKYWAKAQNLLEHGSVIFGIAQDNPELIPPEECRYDTCLVIGPDYIPENNRVRVKSIVGGKYAVFKLEHTEEAVQRGWNSIFIELAAQNLQYDTAKPIMERYKMELVENHYCELCVPVK